MLNENGSHSKHTYITCLHKIHTLLASPFPSPAQEALLNLPKEDFDEFYASMVADLEEWLR